MYACIRWAWNMSQCWIHRNVIKEMEAEYCNCIYVNTCFLSLLWVYESSSHYIAMLLINISAFPIEKYGMQMWTGYFPDSCTTLWYYTMFLSWFTPGLWHFYTQFSSPACLRSNGRFAESRCNSLAVTLETELHKLEKWLSEWTVQTIYGPLFSANTSGTNNTAMCVHYSSRQLGACGCWWIFDERMDPLSGQPEYSVHTQSHTWAHTDTHASKHTHL